LRKVIERRATTVPMAAVVGRCGRCSALAAMTDSIGSGWFAAAALAALMEMYFHKPSAPAPPTTTASRAIDATRLRLFIGAASSCLYDG
jgi:hypothetical protein